MKTFLDSSAFAERLIEEDGSEQVESICLDASELGLSVICVPEIISALNRRLRENKLSRAQYLVVKKQLLADVRDADIIQLTPSVLAAAVHVLETNPVRAMDALHVACALEWKADLFASADERQLAAARRTGLATRRT
ncbi:type II toxin-antitoxin system VapC family toxin [Desulfonatronum thiodismutans]|uniref:type II toxin-antitoxin system VapC family toxin n=1 Tax=Desulfonatronum thiodismutans TaxID=159290 RepID=UPI0004ABE871|nr:type II toxin-antitoxin system VapC family toxin [Desulfonatronum thiodismutans]